MAQNNDFDPAAYLAKKSSNVDVADFDPAAYLGRKSKMEPKVPGLTEEIKGAAAQFAEFAPLQGLRDIASAGAGAIIGEIGERTGLGGLTDQEWLGAKEKDIGQRYQEQLKGIKSEREKALKESDIGKYVGGTLGVASNVLLPLGGPQTKAATEIAKQAALTGFDVGTQGAGLDLQRATEGAGWGAAADVAFRGAGKALKALPGSITGIGEDIANYYMKNAKAVETARPIGEVVDEFVTNVKNYRRKLSNESTAAYNALKQSDKEIPVSRLAATIEKQAERVGGAALTPQARALSGEVSGLTNSLREVAGPDEVIRPENIKDFIRQLDDEIDWEAIQYNRATSRDRALKAIRDDFDSVLKDEKNFPEYAKIMEGISNKVSKLEDLGTALKNEQQAERLFKRIAKNADPRSNEALKALDQEMATNYAKELKDAGIKDLFLKENSRGTRNTVVSGSVAAMAGAALGVPPWLAGAAGATMGPVVDRQGREIYRKILKAAAESPDVLKKYVNVLNSAMSSGPASLLAANKILEEKYPDYKNALGD